MKKTIEDILTEADEELESANYHSWVGIASELYENIKRYVNKPQDRRKVAALIAETVTSKI